MNPLITLLITASFCLLASPSPIHAPNSSTPKKTDPAKVPPSGNATIVRKQPTSKLREGQAKILAQLKPEESDKLKQFAKQNAEKSQDEQEKALKEYSAKLGPKAKEAVEKVIALKKEEDEEQENLGKKSQEKMTKEAKTYSTQMLAIELDNKLSLEQKNKKLDETAQKMPEKVRAEIGVKDLVKLKTEMKQLSSVLNL